MQKVKSIKVEAEARVSGILRGGKYDLIDKSFTFHAGMVEITTTIFDDLRIFDPVGCYGKCDLNLEVNDENLRKAKEEL